MPKTTCTTEVSANIDGPTLLGAANELAAAPTPGQWLKLADYGDWPHPSGLQRFTRPSAETMVRHFQSLWGRLRRRFGGVPLYVGHPDDPAFAGESGHGDTRAYAWVTALEARPDGLYILPRWSEAGRELLHNAFYKFLSPRWQLRPLGDGTFEPVRLLSIGLTNHPNIPGEAIANAKPPVGEPSVNNLLPRLLETLELDAGSPPEALLANAEHLAQAARDTRAAQVESARFYRLATDADAARQTAERGIEAERTAHIETILDGAEWRGQIPPAERAHWREQFQVDFDGAQLALANVQATAANHCPPHRLPVTGATPLTAGLATRRPGAVRLADAERFLTLVNERMTRTGEDYATAFARAKREHAVLFDV
jgi:hypothetical protein